MRNSSMRNKLILACFLLHSLSLFGKTPLYFTQPSALNKVLYDKSLSKEEKTQRLSQAHDASNPAQLPQGSPQTHF